MSTQGVNVLGFFRAEFGQGEAARRVIRALEAAGIPFAPMKHDGVPQREAHPFEHAFSPAAYDVTISCLNAEHMLELTEEQLRATLGGRYTIGIWFWEVSIFPTRLLPAFDLVDELWVASDFVRDVLAPLTLKPVLTFPLAIEPPGPVGVDRRDLGVPTDRYVFLFTFDLYSTLERKNGLGLIEAFTRAFAPGEGPLLYIKTINGHVRTADLDRIRGAAHQRPDVMIVDGYLRSDEVSGLMEACDCYVSLHRSEGFGLTIAEAMSRGKPVIATGYSGNLEFMSSDVAFLVSYELAHVPEGCDPYPAGATWADPDLDEAARLMRHVIDDPDRARAVAERGREAALRILSAQRSGQFMADRLAVIARTRSDLRVLTPARRAQRYLVEGPSIPWEARSRTRGLGRGLRLLLRRFLKPYLVRHREFESTVTAGLSELEAATRATRDRVATLETSARVIGELEQRIAQLERRVCTREDAPR